MYTTGGGILISFFRWCIRKDKKLNDVVSINKFIVLSIETEIVQKKMPSHMSMQCYRFTFNLYFYLQSQEIT
jgi:hypothetical protein